MIAESSSYTSTTQYSYHSEQYLGIFKVDNMSELTFAKSFVSLLDSKPTKLPVDHIEDARTYPARGAVSPSSLSSIISFPDASQYILPKMPRHMTKRQKLAPGQERSLTITLKSLRNPPLEIVLKSQSPLLSILDLKNEVSSQASIPVDKLRILHKKKPVGDSKVVKELVGEEDAGVEFSIMVMGGAASVKKTEDVVDAPVAQGSSGPEVLETEEFWGDLKGFLIQRLRDEAEAEKLFGTFKEAWKKN